MADEKVPPKDITAIFKRLKTVGENKLCFDCRASNPTWASITYGVFLCIDCSAVHRGLGVHLTFIRSTQLDTNWTWLQIRHMQCGGNGNAHAFFRQHNLTTTDSGTKYKSRVASMYREKLNQLVNKSIREIGTTSLHLETHVPMSPEKPEVDFFQDMESNFTSCNEQNINSNEMTNGTQNGNVDVGHLSTSPPKKDMRVPTIGGRKPPANKKKGLGAKKGGLGATKTKANFSAIESEAQQMDKLREQTDVVANNDSSHMETRCSDMPLSTALMYKTSSMRREEEKLKQADPKKAQQLERLGMGFGSKSSVSHSVADSMQDVEQVKPDRITDNNKDYYRSSQPDSFMGIEDIAPVKSEADSFTEEPPSYESRFSNMSSWSSDSSSNKPYRSEKEENDNSRSRIKHSHIPSESLSDDVHKKFGDAKGISSDQLFGNDEDQASRVKLDQYHSSDAISSADLFGEKKKPAGGYDYQNFRAGVSQVTGKLSNMASGVIGSLQSRYSGNN